MCVNVYWTHLLFVQVEEAIIQRKKQELLERYASDALQTQVEESKKLVGLWTEKITYRLWENVNIVSG